MNESKDKSIAWIKNEHGIVSCKEAWLAKELVGKNYGWSFASEEEIAKELGEDPIEKVEDFPVDDIEEDYSMKELRAMAKEAGINSFGKSKAELIDLLDVAFNVKGL